MALTDNWTPEMITSWNAGLGQAHSPITTTPYGQGQPLWNPATAGGQYAHPDSWVDMDGSGTLAYMGPPGSAERARHEAEWAAINALAASTGRQLEGSGHPNLAQRVILHEGDRQRELSGAELDAYYYAQWEASVWRQYGIRPDEIEADFNALGRPAGYDQITGLYRPPGSPPINPWPQGYSYTGTQQPQVADWARWTPDGWRGMPGGPGSVRTSDDSAHDNRSPISNLPWDVLNFLRDEARAIEAAGGTWAMERGGPWGAFLRLGESQSGSDLRARSRLGDGAASAPVQIVVTGNLIDHESLQRIAGPMSFEQRRAGERSFAPYWGE